MYGPPDCELLECKMKLEQRMYLFIFVCVPYITYMANNCLVT